MAKKKYKNKKQNADARLEEQGLRREAGRIVPIAKPKSEVESQPVNTHAPSEPKKIVIPPSVKKVSKPNKSAKAKKPTQRDSLPNTKYGWFQKTIVFTIVFGLVAVGFAALAGSTPSAQSPQTTPMPSQSEQIISEQTITVPAATESPEASAESSK